MEENNVVPIRPGVRYASNDLMSRHAERLVQRFKDGGKRQPIVFTRLSVFLEELEIEVKETYGQRSGKLSQAYGDQYMSMKSRFSAKGGVPPKQLYSTPIAWLEILKGFARELGRNDQVLTAAALERAFNVSDAAVTVAPGDYAEVFVLLDALKEQLVKSVDLIPINEYVTRSGLYLHDGAIQISEWPWEDAGLIDGMIYGESALDFLPRVFGLNAVTVAEVDLARSELDDAEYSFLAHLQPEVPADGSLELREARLVGLALVIDASSGQPDLALLEWDRAVATIKDVRGDVMLSVSVRSPVGRPAELGEGFTGLGDGRRSPEDWHPAGVRAYLKGAAGFNRLLRSTLVRPWIWTDLNSEVWRPTPDEDFDTYPVSAPAHTVAAFIEGNLLYADAAARPDERIDRRLMASASEIEALLKSYREQGEVIRRPHRDALLSEWGIETIHPTLIEEN